MARPRSLAELLPVNAATALFETVPDVADSAGRVAAFTALRDLLLKNWRELTASHQIPLHAMLKLVLDVDRHALFALMAEQKLGDADQTKQKQLRWFQDYLTGKQDNPVSPDTKMEETPDNEGEANRGSDEDVQG